MHNTTMKPFMILAVVCLFLAAAATTSFAKIEKLEGQKAISANANLQWMDTGGADSASRILTVGFSYFPKDFLETKGNLAIMNMEVAGEDGTIYSLLGQVNYNFFRPSSLIVPYAGVQLGFSGYDIGDFDDTAFSFGLQGGAKFFVSEDLSINGELNYMVTTTDPDDVKTTSLLVGLSYYF